MTPEELDQLREDLGDPIEFKYLMVRADSAGYAHISTGTHGTYRVRGGFFLCEDCGGIVMELETHERWHKNARVVEKLATEGAVRSGRLRIDSDS